MLPLTAGAPITTQCAARPGIYSPTNTASDSTLPQARIETTRSTTALLPPTARRRIDGSRHHV